VGSAVPPDSCNGKTESRKGKGHISKKKGDGKKYHRKRGFTELHGSGDGMLSRIGGSASSKRDKRAMM
jgi:hypothetical protein